MESQGEKFLGFFFFKHLGILTHNELSLVSNLYRFGECGEVPVFEIVSDAADAASLHGTSY